MSYQKDRDEFVGVIVGEVAAYAKTHRDDIGAKTAARATQDGVDLARLILRNAATIQRCEELVCSSEEADKDRVPCPAIKSKRQEDCACDYDWHKQHGREHGDTPRVQVEILRARQRIEKACKPWGIKPNFSGDPRGCCVKLILPSGRYNSWGGPEHGFCVPTR